MYIVLYPLAYLYALYYNSIMVDKNISNPLEELYTDSGQIDQEALFTILNPFLRLHRETKTIIFTQTGMGLYANKKLLLLFLAKKALYLLGDIPSELLSPKEIKSEFDKNIPPGTIDGALKRFLERGPLKVQNGKYFIPDFNFIQVQEIFNQPNNE